MAVQALLGLLLFLGLPQEQAPNGAARAESATTEQSALRISGIVVDASSGQPLAGAQVSINAQGIRDAAQSTLTDDEGHFLFERLAPGRYGLFASRKGYVPQFYKQHEQFSTAIVVAAELNTENLRFELRPGASISGQVLDEMNEPVRNAQVMLYQSGLAFGRRSSWQQQSVQTDDLGHYHFGYLAPGTYFVAVSAQPWYAQRVTHQRVQQTDSSGQTTIQEITNGEPELDVVYPITFYPNAPDMAGAAAFTLQAGSAEVADFRLQPVRALHVTVRTPSPADSGASLGPEDSQQVENVWAQVTQPLAEGIQMGVPAMTQQIAPGVVEISGVPPGRFNVLLSSNKNGESKSHTQNVQVTGDTEVTLSGSNSVGTVSGVARLENGAALPPPMTLLFRARGSGEQFPMQVDQNGEFSFKDQSLPAATYDVLVSQPPAIAVKSMTATGAKVSGRSVEIAGGQDVRLKIVLSEGTGRITGFALKDDKPVDGVMIVLVPEVPEHNLVLFRRDQSDSDGSFILRGVHTGKYTVVAIENGWELDWFTPGVIQKYLAGGEPVQVTTNAKIEVKVKVQP
jgi:protocatechuate 3,4-dioxygenase beta subunit